MANIIMKKRTDQLSILKTARERSEKQTLWKIGLNLSYFWQACKVEDRQTNRMEGAVKKTVRSYCGKQT